jgi:hypothetical protein
MSLFKWMAICSIPALALGIYTVNKDLNKFNRSENEDFQEDSLKFNSAHWKRMDRQDKHYMVDDLIKRHLKAGMDSVQVQKLLGPPRGSDKVWYYELGYYKDLDPVYLKIERDASGKVKRAFIEEM